MAVIQDNQHAFDLVVTHLRTQGCRAMAKGPIICLYLTTDGRMCAIGKLIDFTNCYDKVIEGNSIFSLMSKSFSPAIHHSLGHLSIELLSNLQAVHDKWYDEDMDELNAALAETAEKYKLTLIKE